MDPKIIAALITGACALIAAIIAGGFHLMSKVLTARIKSVRDDVAAVKLEVTPNGGHSAHDHLMARIAGVEVQVGHVRDDQAAGRNDVRDLRSEIRRSTDDSRAAIVRHEDTFHGAD